jgi:uncharacterized protein (TIGR03089 family)
MGTGRGRPVRAGSRPYPEAVRTPTSIVDVLALVTSDPGRPRLTWYGDAGERVELSGAVLANWVAKTTNLLVEEFDAGPGLRVGLDLPPHWRTVVWALAAWRCGAAVVLGPGAARAEVVVTDRPTAHDDARQLVAVTLPALARRYDAELPAGAVDAAGAVMTYGDVIGWAPDVDPAETALDDSAGTHVAHADLARWADGASPDGASPDGGSPDGASHDGGSPDGGSPAPGGARVLLETGADRVADVVGMLRTVLGVLAHDGSVVALSASAAADLAAEPGRRDRLVATERVTAG